MADLDDMHCSFCAKPRQECSRLIAGPASVFICDECVGLCASILVDGAPGLSPATGPKMRSITRAADLFCCPPQRTAGGSAIAARPSTGTVGELLARPLCEWHEDNGAVLWWRFPIDEPPYSGSPLDDGWPGYHTHWTECAIPAGHAPANAHPDGCHTTSADAHRDCDGDGHYECATCTRRDPEERERNGDPPIGGVK